MPEDKEEKTRIVLDAMFQLLDKWIGDDRISLDTVGKLLLGVATGCLQQTGAEDIDIISIVEKVLDSAARRKKAAQS